jgi:phosphoglycerate kinase
MPGIKYFPTDTKIENKIILLRLDLNVPLKDKKIQDDTRIVQALSFLDYLVQKKAKIVVISHLGRPEGSRDKNLSLMPIYKYLKEKLETNIYFFTGEINNETRNKVSYLKSSEILLLENIRFHKGEEEDDENFASNLASLGEIYVNNAFSCSHRKQASIHSITKFIKNAYAGPLLKKEIEGIDMIIKNKKNPTTCIIGGSKISNKINVIFNLIKITNNIVIVGAMANNFLVHKGLEIGKSLIEKNSNDLIESIINESKKYNCNIVIPLDCNVSKSFEGTVTSRNLDDIKKDEIILDIGPKTVEKIENILDISNTVLWNGPAGYFENKEFELGTNSIAKKISENTNNKSLISIVGGGDTISAINKSKLKLSFTHLSTAGGAFLEYLEGKDLPGLSVLK